MVRGWAAVVVASLVAFVSLVGMGAPCEQASAALLSPAWGATVRLGETVELVAIVGGWASLPGGQPVVIELKKDTWPSFRGVLETVADQGGVGASGLKLRATWDTSSPISAPDVGTVLTIGDYEFRLRVLRDNCDVTSAAVPIEIVANTLTIDGEDGFSRVPGVTGKGTAQSPYVIEGLHLCAGGEATCLRIANTTAHFVVRDCTLSGAAGAALELDNVRNGWVSECLIEDNAVGILVGSETSDVTFCLNSFRRNGVDVSGAAASVTWDDGYVGNWWASNAGMDGTADGLIEAPWIVGGIAEAVDRFPLVGPYVGGEAPLDSGRVRLEVRYEPGQVFETTMTLRAHTTLQMLSLFSTSSDGESTTTLQNEVVNVGRGNLWELRESVVKDVGTVTVDGAPAPYESEAGEVIMWRSHRFGALAVDATSSDRGTYSSLAPIVFPLRWVGVGDEWTSQLTLDATALQVPSGAATYETTYSLLRFEEQDGRRCAVIAAHADIAGEGTEFDFFLGLVTYRVTGQLTFTTRVDIASGRGIRSEGTIDLTADGFAWGVKLVTLKVRGTVELVDTPRRE